MPPVIWPRIKPRLWSFLWEFGNDVFLLVSRETEGGFPGCRNFDPSNIPMVEDGDDDNYWFIIIEDDDNDDDYFYYYYCL